LLVNLLGKAGTDGVHGKDGEKGEKGEKGLDGSDGRQMNSSKLNLQYHKLIRMFLQEKTEKMEKLVRKATRERKV
jgi:hypothetical protein